MCVGSLLVIVDANASARNTQSLMTNLAFALDSMTRDIRTGYDYFCGDSDEEGEVQDCSDTETIFSFTESGSSLTQGYNNNRIRYQLSNGVIERRLGDNGDAGGWQAITSDNIEITALVFTVDGTDPSDTVQPSVTIYVAGTSRNDTAATQVSFAMQTTITQRRIDI